LIRKHGRASLHDCWSLVRNHGASRVARAGRFVTLFGRRCTETNPALTDLVTGRQYTIRANDGPSHFRDLARRGLLSHDTIEQPESPANLEPVAYWRPCRVRLGRTLQSSFGKSSDGPKSPPGARIPSRTQRSFTRVSARTRSRPPERKSPLYASPPARTAGSGPPLPVAHRRRWPPSAPRPLVPGRR
jgi:hypothetical protein